jgi:eukaryotic-like serine/threonine-protein kinase
MAMADTGILGGRYALAEVIGTGGMATVWRATDEVLGRDVAVKVLNPQFAADTAFLARFEREARNVAALNNSRIVTVFDTGVDTGTPYIVMELLAGRTLRQVLDQTGTLPATDAVTIAAAVCDALEAAHAAGLVHRDIKPANIVLRGRTPSGREVKVLDFGIARAQFPAGGTRTQAVLGTAAYLSPEQASGRSAGPSADLYALGCVFYEMLTGQPPFQAESEVAVAYRQVHDNAMPPSSLRPGLSPQLDLITLQLLAKDPANRPADAAAARAGLLAALAPDKTTVLPAVTGGGVRTSPPGHKPAGRRPPEGRRTEAILAMGLLAALAALAVVLLTQPAASVAGSPPAAHSTRPASPGASQAPSSPSASASARPGRLTPAAKAAGALVSELQAGVTDGQVSQQAGQNLFNQLQQLLFNTPGSNAEQVEQQYAQLVEVFDQYRAQGQISAGPAAALRRDISALGTALGAG